MTEQLALFDAISAVEENGAANGNRNGVRRGRPGAERLLVALVRNGLAEEDFHAAASIALVMDEGAMRE